VIPKVTDNQLFCFSFDRKMWTKQLWLPVAVLEVHRDVDLALIMNDRWQTHQACVLLRLLALV
jgi:hypothetical protein